MSTMFHCHFEIDFLMRASDAALTVMVKGGTPLALRAGLVCMKASGKRVLVVGECDHRKPDGSCAGHVLRAVRPVHAA